MRPRCLSIFTIKTLILVSASVLVSYSPSLAQLKSYSLPARHSIVVPQKKAGEAAARTNQLTPKSLPFWDDFSFTPINDTTEATSNYPVDSLWVNNYTVWINNGIGINPPSLTLPLLTDWIPPSFLIPN